MKTPRLEILLAFVLILSTASGVWAVDEGQTQPRLNVDGVTYTYAPTDIIPLTNGSGNIKGYQCSKSAGGTASVRLHFYVDGGSAQTINPAVVMWTTGPSGDLHSAVMPTNIRFDTSIRIVLQKVSGTGIATCAVSWGLD